MVKPSPSTSWEIITPLRIPPRVFPPQRGSKPPISTLRAAQPELSTQVQELLDLRQAARAAQQWAEADRLRGEIAALGWLVKDTSAGPQLEPMGE